MAVKDTNTRMIITISKKQNEWLEKTAKKLKISKSKLIKWLMDKNIARIATFMTEEDMKKLIIIAKTPWINLDDNEIEETIGFESKYGRFKK